MDYEETFDVLVAGAGVAGIAAALAAARAGLRTALVEKTIMVGGLATTGLINLYLPLCDGQGRQVTYGIAEELLHHSLRYGPGDIPAGWPDGDPTARKQRYQTPFSPAAFILALDEALLEAGVELWLDTLVCQPVLAGRRVVGIEVENKSGRGLLKAPCLIDATGDADLAYRAGAPCAEADNWLSIWALQASNKVAERTLKQTDRAALLNRLALGADHAGRGHPAEVEKLSGTDGRQVTRFVLEGRRLLREYYRARHHNDQADRQTLFPLTLPAMAQFRTTRRIIGQATLSDGQHGRHQPTSVGLVADWRQAGHVWEIPYETLLPTKITGLLVAGRCISSRGDAWEVTRVIPPAALTGEVTGIAATLAVKQGTTPDRLDAPAIQQAVRQQGIPLHLNDVYTS